MGAASDPTALRERLAALRGGRPGVATMPPPGPRPIAPAAATFPGGREEQTPFGPCYLIERRYALTHRHGHHPLGAIKTVAPDLLAALGRDPRLATFPHERLILIDTETTGLAGGTGTHAFLVGLGFLERGEDGALAFVVRQYFLRQLREERALLHALGATLGGYAALVSFNGKSFDWPLLVSRFVLARQRTEVESRAWPHLDLLHPARRVWKHRLPSCSLGAIEREVLGVDRGPDIPGALIPDLYFRYLREGDPRPLLPVLAHNRSDIITLLALLIHLGNLLGDDVGGVTPGGQFLAGADHYGLATLLAALGREAASLRAYRAALAAPNLSPALRREARLALALALKRARRWEEALPLWRESCRAEARRKRPDPWAHIELAKYHEHTARDYPAALAIVEAALSLLDLRGIRDGRAELEYRLARLRRKSLVAMIDQTPTIVPL
jgi:uncharacterized protein YprB with RNaseH-like and TPR domain